MTTSTTRLVHSGFFPQLFISFQNIRRSFHESQNWFFAGAIWWFGIKTDQLLQRKHRKRSVLMSNHQLAPAKYQFCDSSNERLMFRNETKIVDKNPLCILRFVGFCKEEKSWKNKWLQIKQERPCSMSPVEIEANHHLVSFARSIRDFWDFPDLFWMISESQGISSTKPIGK